jgi:hypothetical protein
MNMLSSLTLDPAKSVGQLKKTLALFKMLAWLRGIVLVKSGRRCARCAFTLSYSPRKFVDHSTHISSCNYCYLLVYIKIPNLQQVQQRRLQMTRARGSHLVVAAKVTTTTTTRFQGVKQVAVLASKERRES